MDGLANPSKSNTGAISGTNDYFVLLKRLRDSCDVAVFATKSLLYKMNNERTTPHHWNRSVTHFVTLQHAIPGGAEVKAGFDRVAIYPDKTFTPFKLADLRGED